jgi:hypothetical protein
MDVFGTDIPLVPKKQLKDVEPAFLSVNSDYENCPYCRLYYDDINLYECKGCPMSDAGNCCKIMDSTYRTQYGGRGGIIETFKKNNRLGDLIKLTKEYNREVPKELIKWSFRHPIKFLMWLL